MSPDSPIAGRRSGRLAIALLCAAACGESKAPTPPPVPVVLRAVVQRDVPIEREWIGTTEGNVDAEIRAQVSGYLLSRDYREGSLVEKDALLFTIDARPFRATLDQARGELERARAVLSKAEQDVARFTPLAAEGAVSQQELDNSIQAARAGRAAVESARAVVTKAEVDVNFTKVRAPITGIAGVANAQIGDLVAPASAKPLTAVSQVDPIRVSVPIGESDYLHFASGISRTLTDETAATRVAAKLVLADGSVHPQPGRLVVAGREIDPRTGTITLKAEFPNPDRTIRPGQYARVRVVTELRSGALVIPQRAVTELQGTQQVAVVGGDNVVQIRVVQLGPQAGSDRVVEKGLVAGERIVVEGIQKVRNGSVVAPEAESAAPAAPAASPG